MLMSFLAIYECVCIAPTGLPSKAGEGCSLKAASSVPEVCQILDLSGPPHGAGGQPRCPAHV